VNLIIQASLAEPPTEILFFRFLTLGAHDNLKLDCLLETEQELKDSYYFFLKRQGCMDYLSYIITPPENEFGIRLDTTLNYPLTILTKSITAQNVVNLLGQIKCLSKI
jgi:hypothetical protein